jgi:hypothetical protein
VHSSRTAASATFALKSGLCFFRVFDKSHLRPTGRSQGRLSLRRRQKFTESREVAHPGISVREIPARAGIF